jgi:PadR family transcriptional regulator, regulatory protein AphA
MSSEQLAPGDYVFMAFLSGGAASAYDVKKLMEWSVSFFWSAAQSQVYQQASRLLRDGYIEEKATVGPRGRRLLALTEKGRATLDVWLRSPAPLYRVYDQSLVKLLFGAQGGRSAIIAVLEDQRIRHLELLAEYERLQLALSSHDPGDTPPYERMTLELGIRIEHAWIPWLEETLARLKEAEPSTAGARKP